MYFHYHTISISLQKKHLIPHILKSNKRLCTNYLFYLSHIFMFHSCQRKRWWVTKRQEKSINKDINALLGWLQSNLSNVWSWWWVFKDDSRLSFECSLEPNPSCLCPSNILNQSIVSDRIDHIETLRKEAILEYRPVQSLVVQSFAMVHTYWQTLLSFITIDMFLVLQLYFQATNWMVRAPYVTHLTLSLNEFCGHFPPSQSSEAGGRLPPEFRCEVLRIGLGNLTDY